VEKERIKYALFLKGGVNIMKRSVLVILIISFLLIGCEELREYLTTVSGTVSSTDCKVVLAVKGDGNLLNYLDDVDSLDDESLRDMDLFRGYDITVGSDGNYLITMLSFGNTYIVAVNDDGEIPNELDTLDHIGFYGELDTVTIDTLNIDTFFVYSKPSIISVESGVDQSDINIENMIQFRWFIRIQQMLP
jgi:hypothetical protein